MHSYTREEKLHARKIKKTIIKKTQSADKVYFNVIYISTATESDDDSKFLATEEPGIINFII